MQRTVKEYLWGYQDPILGILKNRLPQLVSNDQISVFGSKVILNKSLLTIFHNFIIG